MAYQMNNSVLALVEEVTEGTPVAPSSANDYTALQSGFSLTPNFDQLENEELTGSIGKAKPVLGLETPSLSFSHYIRGSGIEGQEPDYGVVMHSLMGGKTVIATEQATIAGSTAGSSTAAAILKVGVGIGATFERGLGVLIKDPNGYSVRNVLNITGDDLTLNYNLSVGAPASGVNLGKPVLYKPGVSHPSMTAWAYIANQAAVEMIAGLKVTSGSISGDAGDFINGEFEAEGTKFYVNPIEITASTDTIDFDIGGGALAASVTAQYYRDPHDLALALETAMTAAAGTAISVKYKDATGKFEISKSAGTLNLLWNTGVNTAQTIGGKLGFSVAADDTGSLTYLSDNAMTLVAPHTPNFDDADPNVAKANEFHIGEFDQLATFCPASVSIDVGNEIANVDCVRAESGVKAKVNTSREITISISGELEQYNLDLFKRFRSGQNTPFMWNFGPKAGSNFIAGKVVNVYAPNATINEWSITDNDGIAFLEASLTCYVEDGKGEFYINFL